MSTHAQDCSLAVCRICVGLDRAREACEIDGHAQPDRRGHCTWCDHYIGRPA